MGQTLGDASFPRGQDEIGVLRQVGNGFAGYAGECHG